MGELYNRMQGDLKLKNYAPGTQQAYLQCATRYAQFYVGRSPSVMGEREVRDFLLDLALKQATPAVMKMHLASLRFLYSTTLRRPEVVVGIPWPKVPRTLPDILSGTEVERLLATMEPSARGDATRPLRRHRSGRGGVAQAWGPARVQSRLLAESVG